MNSLSRSFLDSEVAIGNKSKIDSTMLRPLTRSSSEKLHLN